MTRLISPASGDGSDKSGAWFARGSAPDPPNNPALIEGSAADDRGLIRNLIVVVQREGGLAPVL